MLTKEREASVRITEWQMRMLSDIFRIILKEINTDEDKEKLAPGEMGINYTEGSIYVRDPHTGELFCPNSIAHLKTILSKFDPVTNILNADRVSGVRFYSDISQLTQLGISLSADTIVRQMEYPSVLMASIEYENYSDLGFPSESGIMLVYKVSPEFVMASYYDNLTYTTYDGRYNPYTHVLEGWTVSNGVNNNFIETEGGGDSATLHSDRTLKDLDLIVVRITETLNPGATISYNDSAPLPIVKPNGNPLDMTLAANNIIMLLYDEKRKAWIYLSNTESSISAITTILNDRIDAVQNEYNSYKDEFNTYKENAEKQFNSYKESVEKQFTDLHTYIDTQIKAVVDDIKTNPGNIITKTSIFTASIDNVDTVNHIADFVYGVDKLVVNYNQTILRPDIDYVVETSGGLQLKGFTLAKGDVLQFIVLKQVGATP